ncbi:hypothetical protein FRB94_005431 [Tulasnella sp. JGI-2019a]|nr:hypothetical protein FRB93_006163 [Tulasnella sp. JGI-2019a]KAG9000418.1 hypothetical protein FRB94_005431 [Tulasnella sp. JGI-2019a]
MSFNTSWGSSARQDHQTFMNGPQKPTSKDSSSSKHGQHQPITSSTSYAIGAPNPSFPSQSTSTRSIPLNSSVSASEIPFPSEDAARRHLRLSQKHEARIATVKPTSSHKDTSVNIASAFHQATIGPLTMSTNGSLSATASQTFRRGPSVDRLAAPPPPGSRGKSPLELDGQHDKQPRHEKSDSSGRLRRAMSPLMESAGEIASAGLRAVSPGLAAVGSTILSSASNLVRQPSSVTLREPRHHQSFSALGSETQVDDGEENSYDYAAEEALVNSMPSSSQSNGKTTGKRRSLGKRLDEDRRAYKPPVEDDSGSEESEGGTRRRRKGKLVMQRGLLTGVPAAGRKRSTRRKPTGGGVSEEGSFIRDESVNDESMEQTRPPAQRTDTRADDQEVEEELSHEPSTDSINAENLQDLDQNNFEDDGFDDDYHAPHTLAPSLGARLGKVANMTARLVLRTMGVVLIVLYNTLSVVWEILVSRPGAIIKDAWSELRKLSPLVNLKTLGTLALLVSVIYGLSGRSSSPATTTPELGTKRGKWSDYLPGGVKKKPTYVVPDLPVESLEELIDRLGRLEGAFTTLDQEHRGSVDEWKKGLYQIEQESRARETLASRINTLEHKVEGETYRAMNAEEADRVAARRDVNTLENLVKSIRSELATLHGTIAQQTQHRASPDTRTTERLASLEMQLREVSERVKHVTATQPKHQETVQQKPVIKVDGKDLEQMVNSIISKDGVAMPDYALYFGGATIEPMMTSKTMPLGRTSWGTDKPGRPPVTALVPDNTVGNCWPFAGTRGQLGIRLNRVIQLSHITIDHPARELLFDMRSAPKEFNVWVAVEGDENVEKADGFAMEHANAEEPAKPSGPWRLMHFGKFEYDVQSEVRSQTFSIPQELAKLGIATGGVVVEFTGNWGNPDHTCVYRVRAHGSPAQGTAAQQ